MSVAFGFCGVDRLMKSGFLDHAPAAGAYQLRQTERILWR